MDKSEVPKNWEVVKVKEIALSIQYGYTQSSSEEAVGPRFLRITDIQDNKVDWNKVPYCKIEEDNKGKYLLADGDLVFARTGATVGKSFLIKGNIPESVFASYLIRLRFPKEISDKFIYNFFQSNLYWTQIIEGQVGIGQPNVNGTKLGIGVPYIKMNNVDLNGKVDFSQIVYVEVSKDEAIKYSLKKGDILLNTRNSFELVGKVGIVREKNPNCVYNNNLLRIRTKKEYNSLFIGYQLISPSLKKQMLKEKKATTNICALYQRDIFPLKVKVTEFEEQQSIVEEIESRLSVCDKLEETINESLTQSEALRQSILKQAFEGKLVPNESGETLELTKEEKQMDLFV